MQYISLSFTPERLTSNSPYIVTLDDVIAIVVVAALVVVIIVIASRSNAQALPR